MENSKTGIRGPVDHHLEYIIPESIDAALAALLSANGKGCIIAGGSDVMVEIEEGKRSPEKIIDIMKIAELKKIAVESDHLVIGAGVTLTEIVESQLIKGYFPSLVKGCASIGSLQIQNSATLIGNVVTGQPAADGAMVLAPLDPTFTVLNSQGTKQLKMSEMYKGFGKSAVDNSREIVTEVQIPLPKSGEAAAFYRLVMRENLSLPMLNTSAMVKVADGKFVWARIAMGPVGVGPVHAEEAETWLAGKAVTLENLAEAGKLALNNANPRSNPLRGSKAYREQTLPVIVRRVLEDAVGQLGYLTGGAQ